MASASAINTWIEDLATSILPSSRVKTKPASRRPLDTFRRRLRHHNFARTNQFDVGHRFDGLEEKFQVLNRDDLSDALRERRVELRNHYEKWIPDVLDLLLRLSDNPIHKTVSTNLNNSSRLDEASTKLKWADVEADDPVNREDLIWQIPTFSDFSSDENDVDVSSIPTTPVSGGQQERGHQDPNSQQQARIFQDAPHDVPNDCLQPTKSFNTGEQLVLTEIQLVRQYLLLSQGYSSTFFDSKGHAVRLSRHVQVQNASKAAMQPFLAQLQNFRYNLDTVRVWTARESREEFIQTIQQNAERHVHSYLSSVCALEERMLYPRSFDATSILFVASHIEYLNRELAILAGWVELCKDADSLTCLETLFELVCRYFYAANRVGLDVTLPIFLRALDVYMRPIAAWLVTGALEQTTQPIFVQRKASVSAPSNLWRQWFEMSTDGLYRPPSFLKDYVQDVFACGKTIAFSNRILGEVSVNGTEQSFFEGLHHKLQLLAADSCVPFPAAFSSTLKEHVSDALASQTMRLKSILEERCGFSQTLDAFDYIYLGKDGVALGSVESRIYSRIDKCIDDWNDRFLIAAMLEDVYKETDCIDIESLAVYSARTSSRSMESRRRSVQILGALAIDCTLPWPIANIISQDSMAGYRRVALHLAQIRRAKYVLERIAHPRVQTVAIGETSRDQSLAQVMAFMLIQFTNTLYDHFTTASILPTTSRMREDLRTAGTVDEMISVHRNYMLNLEFICLTSSRLKVLREALVALLDMCIRFTDLVSTSVGKENRRDSDDDVETSSFMSAQSRNRNGNRNKRPERNKVDGASDTSDDDDDEEFGENGEGYSSFIVLDGHTTVAREIRKLRTQFQRQLDFFVAGLRGVARGGGGTVEEFEVLADRLDWKVRSSS